MVWVVVKGYGVKCTDTLQPTILPCIQLRAVTNLLKSNCRVHMCVFTHAMLKHVNATMSNCVLRNRLS